MELKENYKATSVKKQKNEGGQKFETTMKKKSSFTANKLRSQEAENLPKFQELIFD